MKINRLVLASLMMSVFLGNSIPICADSPYRDHRFNSYKTLPPSNEGDILFVGNSITNMMNWWEAFGSRDNIRGRGNSGALSAELLENFDDIIKGNPSKVFLMIGTNDLASDAESNQPDSVAYRIIEFLSRTRNKLPDSQIFYQSILPTLVGRRTQEKTEKTNSLVNDWIVSQNDPNIFYIDLYTPMLGENGGLKNSVPAPDLNALSYDGLHLTQEGYKIWLDIIKDYVGYDHVYGEKAVNLAGGMQGSNAMRVSYFGALPVSNSDILLIGDEMIHNGEWQERLNNTNIKDRGIGWGFPGMSIEMLEGSFDPILSGNALNGVPKETPRAVALYAGTGEVKNGWNSDSLFQSYSHAISSLRERLPETPIFAMTLLPFPKTEAEKNKVIGEFNQRILNELASPISNIKVIDLYSVVGGENREERFFMGENNPFLSGDGYVVVAEAIGKELNNLITLSDYSLLPLPQSIVFQNGLVKIGNVKVNTPCWEGRVVDILDNLSIKNEDKNSFSINCRIDVDTVYGDSSSDEAYRLKINENGVDIMAPSPKGIYWGFVTLNQLVKSTENATTLPICEIVDWPAFPIRGFMIDTGRSFISLEELMAEIDVMSKFKMNTFHWHLSDNQGWRLESNIYPQLNDSSNMLRDYGKYYTKEDAKKLVKYASERNIMVIPELDMPGHSQYFDLTFGFDMQSKEGMKTLKKLISEACETFEDLPYLHIGTDEVQFTNPDFVPEMVKLVREHGKKVISWNPGWKYEPGEVDMIQMWSYRGKPTPGIPAIDSRYHYINHFDTYADIVALYRSNVYGEPKATDDIKGVIIALWNDRYIEDESSIAVQNNLYPLIMATAERGWDGGGTEYFDSLGTNMAPVNSKDFKNFADFERRMLDHKKTTLKDKTIPYVKQTNVNWLITEAFPNGGNLETSFPPEFEGPQKEYIYNDSIYTSKETTGAGIYLRHVWGTSVPAFIEKPEPNHTVYAFTNVYSPIDQEVGLQFETQNYSRSEMDLPPLQGEWDYRKSKVWVNGIELKPRVWSNSHTEKSNEISLGNENMATSSPILLNLHKGWNSVMIKLPVGSFKTPEIRLVKWMFTFVFTTPDGKEAVPGLLYSVAP